MALVIIVLYSAPCGSALVVTCINLSPCFYVDHPHINYKKGGETFIITHHHYTLYSIFVIVLEKSCRDQDSKFVM